MSKFLRADQRSPVSKMKTPTLIAWLIVASTVSAHAQKFRDQYALTAHTHFLAQAVLANRPESAARLFADGATVHSSRRVLARGTNEIVTYWRSSCCIETNCCIERFLIFPVRIRSLTEITAAESGYFAQLSLAYGAMEISGPYRIGWRQTEGVWKIESMEIGSGEIPKRALKSMRRLIAVGYASPTRNWDEYSEPP